MNRLSLMALVLLSTMGPVSAKSTIDSNRDKYIGNILKNALETYHYNGTKIDASISEKAFKEFLKKIDGSKQFLTKEDIKQLEVYKNKMHDEMVSGDFGIVTKSVEIMKKRIALAEGVRKEVFKGQFDFNGNETVQLDPEKRDWVSSEKDLKENWKLVFKQATLNRYLQLIDEQDDKVEKKDDKKSKKKAKPKTEKKLSDPELRKKAHEVVSDRFKKIFERLNKQDRDDMMDNFYNSIAGVLDPHTVYMPAKKKEEFDIDITGKLEGIGAVLQEDGSYIKIVQIVPGGPAWRSKELEVDDVILSVAQGDKEPVDLTDMRVDDAVRYIRGKKGTEVRLTVKKADGTRKIVPLVRDEIEVAASFAKSSVLKMKGSNNRIGYIELPKFYRDFENSSINCTDDVKRELERLKGYKVDGVILDLRNNGGGALEDARLMSGLFIEKGPIVQVKNHLGQIEVLEDTDPSITYDGPLIVMTNRFSASASEILAGAMQDYKRAVIVGGDYSHGKGTVQAVLDLNRGPLVSLLGNTLGALKITIQKFYRVTGASTQYKGITPDIILPDIASYTDSREQDLDYSLPWDQISARTFKKWSKFTYNVPELKKKSEARVAKDDNIQQINRNLDYLNKKKKETVVSLNLTKVKAEDAENKKMAEKLKLDKENMNLDVTDFEDSLKAHEKIKEADKKKWESDFTQRKEEWVSSLRKDSVLSETVNIANDIVNSLKK